MERYYRETYWSEVSKADPEYLIIQGIRVPYVVFDNSEDVTTQGGQALGGRLEEALKDLWALYEKRPMGI